MRWIIVAAALSVAAPLHSEPRSGCPNRIPAADMTPGESAERAVWTNEPAPAGGWLHAAAGGTRSCLGCHDGSMAEDIGEVPQLRDGASGEHGHPVDIEYAAAWRQNRATLRDPAEVARILPLPDGRVQCVSCHAPGSGTDGQLSRPLRQSALCFACHTM